MKIEVATRKLDQKIARDQGVKKEATPKIHGGDDSGISRLLKKGIMHTTLPIRRTRSSKPYDDARDSSIDSVHAFRNNYSKNDSSRDADSNKADSDRSYEMRSWLSPKSANQGLVHDR